MKYWDGSAWKDIASIKYWDGSQWVDARALYYWDGVQWVKAWESQLPSGTTFTKTYNANITGDSKDVYIQHTLQAEPSSDFSVSVDMRVTIPSRINPSGKVISKTVDLTSHFTDGLQHTVKLRAYLGSYDILTGSCPVYFQILIDGHLVYSQLAGYTDRFIVGGITSFIVSYTVVALSASFGEATDGYVPGRCEPIT